MEEQEADPKAVKGEDFRIQFANSWRAAGWLGITNLDPDELFMNGGEYNDIRDEIDALPATVRRQAAINVLSHLRDTGEVDWRSAIDRAKA